MPEPTPGADARTTRHFVVFLMATVAAVAAYVAFRPGSADAPRAPSPASSAARPAVTLDEVRSGPHVYYRSAKGGEFAKVVVASLDAPNDARVVTGLSCERMDAGLARGICLEDNRIRVQPPAIAAVFSRALQIDHRIDLPGFPSRTRLSGDERYAATTVFVTGESYASAFATRTHIVDLAAGAVVAELEQFTTRKDGRVIRAVDFNFWGVTFTEDSQRFYATLGTGGKTYLVAGDLSRRQFDVLREDVECPSLSPDERHLAFKSRVAGTADWRLHVLDLQTMSEWPITGETRSIDDQVEWLDEGHVLYQFMEDRGLPEVAVNVWMSPIARDANDAPRLFIHGASSPAVVRPPVAASRQSR